MTIGLELQIERLSLTLKKGSAANRTFVKEYYGNFPGLVLII
jgi:hypothetical protein